jgi:1-acyl-sn-glycerol-3-phosphate acyltransferase
MRASDFLLFTFDLRGRLLRTMLMFCFVGPWCVLGGALAMFFGALKHQPGCRWVLKCWSGGLLSVAGVRLQAPSPPPLDAQPCLFFSNHQSALDIPILLQACLPTHDVRFMAKESLFKIPVFGWGMRLSGFIPIRRHSARHSAEIFQEMLGTPGSTGIPARDTTVPAGGTGVPAGGTGVPAGGTGIPARDTTVPAGGTGVPAGGTGVPARVSQQSPGSRSYIIFPEGTRSPDGRLQPFKKGAIGLALRMNLPIVPVTLIDACHANPKGRYLVRPGTVRVIFHEPLSVAADSGRERRDALAAQLFATICSALPQDQQPQVKS